ncbi:hypothetical protein Tco_0641922 [Tanacetum coccineum]
MENVNLLSPPESPTSPNSRRVRELNKLLESLNLVVSPTISEPSCLKIELGFERFFKEMKNENVEKEVKKEIEEEEEREEIGVDYFDKFSTKDGPAYHKNLVHGPCPFFHRRLPIIGGRDPLSISVIKFTNKVDEVSYQMPHKVILDEKSLGALRISIGKFLEEDLAGLSCFFFDTEQTREY